MVCFGRGVSMWKAMPIYIGFDRTTDMVTKGTGED